MIDLSQGCLFCGSDKGLNTTMTVKVDDTEYNVAVCDEHEDMAAPKTVKGKVVEKAKEIEAIKEQAAKLGLKVEAPSQKQPTEPEPEPAGTTSQSLTGSVKPNDRRQFHQGLKPAKATPTTPTEAEAPTEALTEAPAEIAEAPTTNVPVDPAIGINQQNSYKQVDGIETVQTTKQVVQTSDGRPIHIPKTIHDSAGGKTDIRVIRGGGDAALQRRFKQLGHVSQSDAPSPDFSKGYTVRDCRACNGSGISRINAKKECPKCGGDGFNKV